MAAPGYVGAGGLTGAILPPYYVYGSYDSNNAAAKAGTFAPDKCGRVVALLLDTALSGVTFGPQGGARWVSNAVLPAGVWIPLGPYPVGAGETLAWSGTRAAAGPAGISVLVDSGRC